MRLRKQRGLAISLLLSCHPLPALAMTVVLAAAAALSGRSGDECLLVAATIATGQLTVGGSAVATTSDATKITG